MDLTAQEALPPSAAAVTLAQVMLPGDANPHGHERSRWQAAEVRRTSRLAARSES